MSIKLYKILGKTSPITIKLVYLSAVNADMQGTAKWIELNQTGNSYASVQSAFPAVVVCKCPYSTYLFSLVLICFFIIIINFKVTLGGLSRALELYHVSIQNTCCVRHLLCNSI